MERINKFLAHAGAGSRRQVEDLVRAGRVQLEGQVIHDLATRVPEGANVLVDGKPLQTEKLVYWLVNKPRGYLCTNRDPGRRPVAIDLIPHVKQRVYTVGRLDEDSEGLLLLTNDGELAHKLMHPRFGVEKTYMVQVAGLPTNEDLKKIQKGIWLSAGHVRARSAKRVKKQGQSAWLRIVLSEGKNREIRRMLARLEHKVIRLVRVAIGPVALGNLKQGKSRPINNVELKKLRRLAEAVSKQEAQGGEE